MYAEKEFRMVAMIKMWMRSGGSVNRGSFVEPPREEFLVDAAHGARQEALRSQGSRGQRSGRLCPQPRSHQLRPPWAWSPRAAGAADLGLGSWQTTTRRCVPSRASVKGSLLGPEGPQKQGSIRLELG